MGLWNWIQGRTEIISSIREKVGAFRVGHLYTESMIEKVSRRDDVAYFWTTGIVQGSFFDGFTIVDEAGEEPDWITEFQKENYLPEITRGVIYERKWGQVTFCLFQDDDDDTVELKAFRKDHTKFNIDKETGKFISFELNEYISKGCLPIPHEIEGEDLDNIFHEVLRPDKYKYQGISVLEPMWDLIDARRILLQALGVLIARYASGVRVATVEMRSAADDSAVVSAMKLGLGSLESDDVSIVLRSGYKNSKPWKDTLEVMSGPDYNFTEKIGVINQGLSVATNISKNFFEGVYVGSLTGAETVLQILFAALKRIQDDWSFRIERIIERWCEIKGKTWLPEYSIKWNLKPILTEQDKATVEYVKSQTVSMLYSPGIIDLPEARKLFGLDPDKVITKPANITIEGIDKKLKQDNESNDEEE